MTTVSNLPPCTAVESIHPAFPVLRRKDRNAHGTHRTKDSIIRISGALAEFTAPDNPMPLASTRLQRTRVAAIRQGSRQLNLEPRNAPMELSEKGLNRLKIAGRTRSQGDDQGR